MPLILAIEPDRRQAAQISTLARNILRVELVLADSTERAVAALGERVPDLILTSALLSPRDEAALADRLRELNAAAAHVQTLTVPVLGTLARRSGRDGGVLSRLRRNARVQAAPDGCDPAVFAHQVAEYLESAAAERETLAAAAATRHSERHIVDKVEPHASIVDGSAAAPSLEPAFDVAAGDAWRPIETPPGAESQPLGAGSGLDPTEQPIAGVLFVDSPPPVERAVIQIPSPDTTYQTEIVARADSVEPPIAALLIVEPAFVESVPPEDDADTAAVLHAIEVTAVHEPAHIEVIASDEVEDTVATDADEIDLTAYLAEIQDEVAAARELAQPPPAIVEPAVLVVAAATEITPEELAEFEAEAVAEAGVGPTSPAETTAAQSFVAAEQIAADAAMAANAEIRPAEVWDAADPEVEPLVELWMALPRNVQLFWPALEGSLVEADPEQTEWVGWNVQSFWPVLEGNIEAEPERPAWVGWTEPANGEPECEAEPSGAVCDAPAASPWAPMRMVAAPPGAAPAADRVQPLASIAPPTTREPVRAAAALANLPPSAPEEDDHESATSRHKRSYRYSNRPAQDEWGLFDPQLCGFEALLTKLDEITEEDTPAKRPA